MQENGSPEIVPGPSPAGTVTLVFTDIEGSSSLWDSYGDAFRPVQDQHHRIVREAMAAHRGTEIKVSGDGFFLAFTRASDAVMFAIATQRGISEVEWTVAIDATPASADIKLRIRIGAHSGEALIAQDAHGGLDYLGPTVNIAARVSGAAHGGQILISEATRLLAKSRLHEEVEFTDLGTHRLKGVGEQHLWQVVGDGLDQEFPPPNTLNIEEHNLPLPPTPLIGRTTQLEYINRLLGDPRARLVTLTGFGGIGKTRIALEVAEAQLHRFSHGVWWIPLEAATSADEMLQRIAESLHLRLLPQPTLREQVLNYCRQRQMLLVLDNLEQIRDHEAGEAVHAILQASPLTKCLATSRRALELSSEHTIELTALADRDAEALFTERATGHKTSFAMTPQNQADITAICHSLEGMPLALEIAASMVVLMTPRQIVRRLNDQLAVLKSSDPSLPARHQALRVAIDWSYNLLSANARAVFVQLAAFSGSFNLEAVEAICAATEVVGGVLELRTHSLLGSRTDVKTQQERLYMLESVRAFAAEKLDDPTVRERHAAFFLDFATAQAARLHTADELEALAELDVESDNLRGALEWAITQQTDAVRQSDVALRLAATLGPYWLVRGSIAEGRRWLGRVLDTEPVPYVTPHAFSPPRAAALLQAGMLAQNHTDFMAAHTLLTEALEAFRALGDRRGEAQALNALGMVVMNRNDFAGGGALAREGLAIARELRDRESIAYALSVLSALATHQSDYAGAQELLEEKLGIMRESGDRRNLALTMSALGLIALNQGTFERARALMQNGLAIMRELEDRWGIGVALNNLGMVMLHTDQNAARHLLEESLPIFRDLGIKGRHAQTLSELGEIARLQCDTFAAIAYYNESLSLYREAELFGGVAWNLHNLAWLQLDAEDPAGATANFKSSLQHYLDLDSKQGQAHSLAGLGAAAAASGDFQRAARLLGASEALREALGISLIEREYPNYEATVAGVREQLGDAMDEVWTAGKSLALEQALDYAMK